MATQYFLVETDGKVYLEERNGRLDLPTSVDGLPFKVTVREGFTTLGAKVAYASPLLERHPDEWHDKDLVPALDQASPIARAAVLATMHRLVVNALAVDRDRVLMVKANRGLSAGWWNLPGGFLEWDEGPEKCLKREVQEELGATVARSEMLAVLHHQFEKAPYYMVAFLYLCALDRNSFRLDRKELDEAAWFPFDRAAKETRNPFAKEGIKILKARMAAGGVWASPTVGPTP